MIKHAVRISEPESTRAGLAESRKQSRIPLHNPATANPT